MKNFIATTVLALVAAINAPASAHHDGHHGHHGHHGGHHQMHQPQQRVVWSQVYTYHIGNAGVCYNRWRHNNPTYRILTYNGYTVQYQIPTYLPPVHCPPPVVHCPPPVVVHPPVCYPQQTVIISGGSCNRVVYRRRSSCTTFSFGFSW